MLFAILADLVWFFLVLYNDWVKTSHKAVLVADFG